jgi:hypothetical protein
MAVNLGDLVKRISHTGLTRSKSRGPEPATFLPQNLRYRLRRVIFLYFRRDNTGTGDQCFERTRRE